MQDELGCSGISLFAVQFIHCACPLDRATAFSEAALWTLDRPGGSIVCKTKGALGVINQIAAAEDSAIEKGILNGEIDGLISISADFDGNIPA